jgi:hypothetical protein
VEKNQEPNKKNPTNFADHREVQVARVANKFSRANHLVVGAIMGDRDDAAAMLLRLQVRPPLD